MNPISYLRSCKTLLLAAGIAVLAGCATPESYDYSAFHESKPASILVMPPVNQSPDIKASYGIYSQVSVPLGEAGYYVLPVGVVDETFKQNGMLNAEEAREASPQKLHEIFGADSVLYIDVTEYGSSYKILSSEVAVSVSATLMDLRTGKVLWKGQARASSAEQQNNNGGGLIGMMIVALVDQVVNTLSDRSYGIAGIASGRLLSSSMHNGILPGPRARPEGGK